MKIASAFNNLPDLQLLTVEYNAASVLHGISTSDHISCRANTNLGRIIISESNAASTQCTV